MSTSYYEYVLDECRMRCPFAEGEINRWYKYADDEIIVIMKNGGAIHYNNLLKCYTYRDTIEELEQFLKFDRNKYKEEDEYRSAWSLEFAKKLYVKMLKIGINQAELSYRTGISQGSIANYVNGRTVPNIYYAYKIAEVLGCTLNDLVNF